MLDFIIGIYDSIISIGRLIVDFFTSLLKAIPIILQCINYVQGFYQWIPSSLLIFAVAFVAIYVINRLSFGSNQK